MEVGRGVENQTGKKRKGGGGGGEWKIKKSMDIFLPE